MRPCRTCCPTLTAGCHVLFNGGASRAEISGFAGSLL